jgi:septal ring factor EnvC (AmiA/AmiB activator)
MKGSKEFYEELQQKKSVQLQQLEDGNASCLDVLIELESDKKYLKKHIEDIDLFKEKYQSQIESEASSYSRRISRP